eukprot:gnl/TRDRNA2_/TRDRNA2_177993_c0_seq2.p1 gnl/TRDRNA2_/TRDRNA2_177993_c0~~gnl/TRDRNA2_/TRDRNA2_177993_c0_seq2.p1  ORF type:complete len:296 (-),score=-0.72 gnl/TRDRNA2_/TRDRNA2_177993_c0_seq2:181-1068(-)
MKVIDATKIAYVKMSLKIVIFKYNLIKFEKMGERKVLNKYFPPDFDPSKLPKWKYTSDNFMKVRMMMAMTVQCTVCGVFIHKGTKFNMRKEDVLGEDYLGIQIYRFYFKCPRCSSEITFKTDPKNHDYSVEYGANRTFELRRNEELESRERRRRIEHIEKGLVTDYKENVDSQSSSTEQKEHIKHTDLKHINKFQHSNSSIDSLLAFIRSKTAVASNVDKSTQDDKLYYETIKKNYIKSSKKQKKETLSIQKNSKSYINIGNGPNSLYEHKQKHFMEIKGQKMILQSITNETNLT